MTAPRLLASLLLTTALTGCLSAPSYDPPALGTAIPAHWTAGGTSGTVTGDWLSEFRSQRLDQVVETALRQNPDLRVAAARLAQAQAGTRIATSALFPQVGFDQTASRGQRVFTTGSIPVQGLDDPTRTTANTFGVQVDLSWEIDLWGRIRAGRAAALADQEAARDQLLNAQLSLAAQTAKAWFAVCEAHELVQVADETVDSFARSTRIVRDRFEQGIADALDLRLALSNEENAIALREARLQQLDAATRQLEIIMGNYPAGSYKASSMPEVRGNVPAGIPAEILARRPDLRAAERQVAAASKREVEARLALLPRIALTAAGGTTTDALKNILSNDFGVWTIAANLTQPLFDGGRLIAEKDRQTAIKEEAEANYVSAALEAFREVETALEAEQLLKKRERADRASSDQAGKALDLALERYSAGLQDYLFVLEAQRTYFNARSRALNTRRERLDNRINLHLALGGDFTTRL